VSAQAGVGPTARRLMHSAAWWLQIFVVAMRVRLTRKLAERIDDIDLTRNRVGDVLDLPAAEARLLVAEEWAISTERRRVDVGCIEVDRRRIPGEPWISDERNAS
jgi:hypothetical protein